MDWALTTRPTVPSRAGNGSMGQWVKRPGHFVGWVTWVTGRCETCSAKLIVHKSPNFHIRTFVHAHTWNLQWITAFKRSNLLTIRRTFVLAKFCSSFVHLSFRNSQFKLFWAQLLNYTKTNWPIRKRLPPSCRACRDLSNGMKMSKPETDLVTFVHRTLDIVF